MKPYLPVALALTAGLALPAHALTPPTRARGTVKSVAGDNAVIHTGSGDVIVLLPATGYVGAKAASLADIKQGNFIGTAAVPYKNGTLKALEITLFPESMRGAGEGSYPWDLGKSGSMTNGTIGTLATGTTTRGTVQSLGADHGVSMTVTYKGGKQTVVVPASTPVVLMEPGTRAMLKPGVHVVVFGPVNGNMLIAKGVIMGENGVKPPM